MARVALDEFLAMPGVDERRLELVDGVVHEFLGFTWRAGRVVGRIGAKLDHVGLAAVRCRAVIPPVAGSPGHSLIADVAFYRENPPAADEWMTRPPDVAVEVLSIGQSRIELRRKVDIYLHFGAGSVWVVDPERELIDVYEHGARRTLSGDHVVESAHAPGFRATVAELLAP
ncbi:MAG: Uma2 family endonuclease [Dehalococcoidia bacterium]|nr:Uma2 family endonuclease [Dehalococcoidia bacterium]